MLRSFYFYFVTCFTKKILVPQVPEATRSADPQFSNTLVSGIISMSETVLVQFVRFL